MIDNDGERGVRKVCVCVEREGWGERGMGGARVETDRQTDRQTETKYSWHARFSRTEFKR